MRNFDYEEELAFSGLFDQGAEVFTRKMFRHSQAKAQENWNEMKKDRQPKKMFAVRSRSRRARASLAGGRVSGLPSVLERLARGVDRRRARPSSVR